MISLSLEAQLNSLSRDDKIRISFDLDYGQYFHGTYLNFKKDNIYILIDNKSVAIPLQNIKKIEVARGKKSVIKKGAIIGAIAGGIGLVVVALISVSQQQERLLAPEPGEAFFSGLILGALGGAGAGALAGSQIKTDYWEEIYQAK